MKFKAKSADGGGIKEVTITHGDESVTVTPEALHEAAEKLSNAPAEDEPDDAELLAQIRDAETIVAEKENEFFRCKEEATNAKKDMEEAVYRLRRLIRAKDEKLPLFDSAESANGKPVTDWRRIPLKDLKLNAGALKSLTDVGLTTMGAIADYSRANDGLTGIKGIRGEKASHVADRITAYWQDHPEPAKQYGEWLSAETFA